MSDDEELRHDLSLALHTITETNQSIRYADTKAGALAGIQALMVTVLAARHPSATGTAVLLLHTVCLLGVLVSALLLGAGQIPRLFLRSGHLTRNSFPDLVGMPPDELLRVPTWEQRHRDAWRHAALLAGIAVTKFRWLTGAAVATIGTLTAVLAWLAIITWSSS